MNVSLKESTTVDEGVIEFTAADLAKMIGLDPAQDYSADVKITLGTCLSQEATKINLGRTVLSVHVKRTRRAKN